MQSRVDVIKLTEPIFMINHKIETNLNAWSAPSLIPVINASGVILHTNLGRAPLSRSAIEAVQKVSFGYSNLEYDLVKGQRGSRLIHAERLLQQLTGAQAALVVNNNAAAVLLILSALAHRRSVVIARSQLVEIGGGFRVPDVMQQSGARLVEIGTTNRVHLTDYDQAIDDAHPALVMRAHRSNFRIVYRRRQVVFSEGNPASGLFLVCRGSVKLYHADRFGREHILEIAGPGAVLGELSLDEDQTLSVSAESLTDAQLSYLPRDAWRSSWRSIRAPACA